MILSKGWILEEHSHIVSELKIKSSRQGLIDFVKKRYQRTNQQTDKPSGTHRRAFLYGFKEKITVKHTSVMGGKMKN